MSLLIDSSALVAGRRGTSLKLGNQKAKAWICKLRYVDGARVLKPSPSPSPSLSPRTSHPLPLTYPLPEIHEREYTRLQRLLLQAFSRTKPATMSTTNIFITCANRGIHSASSAKAFPLKLPQALAWASSKSTSPAPPPPSSPASETPSTPPLGSSPPSTKTPPASSSSSRSTADPTPTPAPP